MLAHREFRIELGLDFKTNSITQLDALGPNIPMLNMLKSSGSVSALVLFALAKRQRLRTEGDAQLDLCLGAKCCLVLLFLNNK